jgi:hypothetical protein
VPRWRRVGLGISPGLNRHFSGPPQAGVYAAASNEGFQQDDVVIVGFALNVAMVESQLQRHRQAVHQRPSINPWAKASSGYRNGS